MVRNLLVERNLPSPVEGVETVSDWENRRVGLKELLCREEYGFLPPKPQQLTFEELSSEVLYGGKFEQKSIRLTAIMPQGDFSFDITTLFPVAKGRYPLFINLCFRPDVPDRYLPAEEICDNGFGIITVHHNFISPDRNSFDKLLDAVLFKDGRKNDDCGKIGLWSWAASRAMDYAQTLDCVDLKNVCVIGHSRLGKTALLTGALDERFAFVVSNEGGCSGEALSRGKTGECISDITKVFPYWFCENYKKYADNEQAQPFDQHYLIALCAPRRVMIGAAVEDLWADPVSQFLSCAAVEDVYALYSEKALVAPDRLPLAGDNFDDGCVAFHLRAGTHTITRQDWQVYMKYIRKHINR